MGKSNTNNKSDKTGSYTEFFYKAFCNILLVSIPLLIISALVLNIPRSSADNSITSSDELTLTLSSSCTLRSEVEKAHTATLNSGQYEGEIGTTRVNTYCNDNNGYSIYAIGSSNNVDGNTDLVSNINDNYNISTGLYNSSTITPSSPSTWSMKLTAGTGTGINPDTGASVVLTPPTIVNGFDNYSLVPSTYTLVASRSSATDLSSNTDVTGSYFTTTYDIYASSYQPAGTYSGKVKYLILHPQSTTNTIPYIDAAFAIAGKQKQANVVDPITGQTGNFYRMQDMTTDICNSVSQNGEVTSTQLVDIRDNKLYWVTKLKDGHCWMTQNLDLDLVTYINEQGQEVMKPLTSNDTDLTDHSLTGAYADSYSYDANTGITTWTPKNATRNYQGGTGTAWSANANVAYSLDPGNWYWDGDDSTPNCNYLDSTKGCTHFTQNVTSANAHLAVGNYYNWSAAIASDNSSSLSSSTYSNIVLNPQNSICPKGWRLPTISNMSYATVNSTSEFGRLNRLYNDGGSTDPKLISDPLWFVRNGYFGGSFNNSGSEAGYWSSTVSGGVTAYNLWFKSTSVAPAEYGNFGYRVYGKSVRCLAR